MKFSDIDRNIRNGIIVFTVSGILIVLFSVCFMLLIVAQFYGMGYGKRKNDALL